MNSICIECFSIKNYLNTKASKEVFIHGNIVKIQEFTNKQRRLLHRIQIISRHLLKISKMLLLVALLICVSTLSATPSDKNNRNNKFL